METRDILPTVSTEIMFSDLILGKKTYIDQSHQLYHMLDSGYRKQLYVWPSGFGKSLLLSMAAAFLDKFSEPALFENLEIMTNPKYHQFVRKHHRQYFVLYIDMQSILGKTFEEFVKSYYDYMRRLINELELKIRRFLNTDKIEPCDALSGINVEGDFENFTVRHKMQSILADIYRWLARYIDADKIHLFIDSYDAPARHALLQANFELSEKIDVFISNSMVFIGHWKERNDVQRCTLAGQFVPHNKTVLSDHYRLELPFNFPVRCSSGLNLGVSEETLTLFSKRHHQSMNLSAVYADCGKYYSNISGVIKPDLLVNFLGVETQCNKQSGSELIKFVINRLNSEQIEKLVYILDNLNSKHRYDYSFQQWQLGSIENNDESLTTILLLTGYITFKNSEQHYPSASGESEFLIPNPSLRAELDSMIATRKAELESMQDYSMRRMIISK